MKSIKHIREFYNSSLLNDRGGADQDRLTKLIRAGLFDVKKLSFIKRALNKDINKMTPAEKKVLIDLLNALIDEVVNSPNVYGKVRQNVMTREEFVNEARQDQQGQYLYKHDPRFPKSPKVLPAIIILKRKAMRVYPDNQVIGLYYSQQLDKYVSIPFETNERSFNVGLSEATEDSQESGNRRAKVPVNPLNPNKDRRNEARKSLSKDQHARRREEIRSAEQEKLLDRPTKNLSAKGAKVARRIGIRKAGQALVSGDTHQALGLVGAVIGSKIRSALARNKKVAPARAPAPAEAPKKAGWGTTDRRDPKKVRQAAAALEEAKNRFYSKLEEKRTEIDEGAVTDYLKKKAQGALGSAAKAAGSLSTGKVGAFVRGAGNAITLGGRDYIAGKINGDVEGERKTSERVAKEHPTADLAGKVVGTAVGAIGAAGLARAGLKKIGAAVAKRAATRAAVTRAAVGAGAAAAGAAAGKDTLTKNSSSSNDDSPTKYLSTDGGEKLKAKITKKTERIDTTKARQAQDTTMNRRYMRTVQEDTKIINSIRNGALNVDCGDGKQIIINNTIAEKVVSLYDSLNQANRKKMLEMINEDSESFKKVVNFAVRQ